jgi:ferritin-like metal-binding protein YciE
LPAVITNAETGDFMASTDIGSIYATALRNTRALEKQGLEQMERQLSGLERYPDYAAVLRRHVETTKAQLNRLDQALAAVGESPSGLKEAITSVAGSIGAAVHSAAQDETLKNLYAGYAYQYDQVAAYRSLAIIAERAGKSSDASAFRSTAEEEVKAADEIAKLIEPVTKTYLDLTLSGQKADS